MRLPSWLRARPTKGRAGVATFTITADATEFVAAMWRVRDDILDRRYRRRIALERTLGLSYVSNRTDRLCRDLGFDPAEVFNREESD